MALRPSPSLCHLWRSTGWTGDILKRPLLIPKYLLILWNAVMGENTSIHPAKRPPAPALNDCTDSWVYRQWWLILYGLTNGFTWIEDSPWQSHICLLYTAEVFWLHSVSGWIRRTNHWGCILAIIFISLRYDKSVHDKNKEVFLSTERSMMRKTRACFLLEMQFNSFYVARKLIKTAEQEDLDINFTELHCIKTLSDIFCRLASGRTWYSAAIFPIGVGFVLTHQALGVCKVPGLGLHFRFKCNIRRWTTDDLCPRRERDWLTINLTFNFQTNAMMNSPWRHSICVNGTTNIHPSINTQPLCQV